MLLKLLQEQERRRQHRKIEGYYPDDGPLRRELYPKHTAFFRAGLKYRERCMLAGNRVGKALAHGTKVATPNGWVAIEDLRPGDRVIAGDGSVTKVIGVYPQGIKPLYCMRFDVGEEILCCGEHLWLYQHPNARYPYRQSHGRKEDNPFFGQWNVANTETILAQVGPAPLPRRRIAIPACKQWGLKSRSVPLDPYALGLLIGDGGLSGSSIKFTSADDEIVLALKAVLPAGVRIDKDKSDKYGWVLYASENHGRGRNKNPLINILRDLGLFGLLSYDKHVPALYLLNDADTRLDLLRGLMDTDGTISATGAMDFSSVSRQLAEDVAFLVHSLGGKARIEERQTYYSHNGARKAGAISYRVKIRLNVCPFRLARKAARWNPRKNTTSRIVHSIRPADQGPCTCIEVAHPSHTYIIEHGIVTHNTEGIGGYETTLHLTGQYPEWWEGRRFDHPISAWAAGKTGVTTRDIIQTKLMGPPSAYGTGLIPKECIGRYRPRSGIPDAVDTVRVKHYANGRFDGWSLLGFRSYDQGRRAFEGTEKDLVWLDEEPTLDIYAECVIRTMTTGGMILCTFTPLEGISEVVKMFLPGGRMPSGV